MIFSVYQQQKLLMAPKHFGLTLYRFAIFSLSFIVLVALTSCQKKDNDSKNAHANAQASAEKMPALPVTVIEATYRKIPINIEAVGQTEGSKEVEVRARVNGILQKQLYKEGETVKAGSVLFQIDPAPYEIVLAQAKAGLTQEKANLEKAQRDSNRLKTLVNQRAISQKEFDDATSNFKLANASLQAAQAKVKEAALNLSYTKVTAPITGVSGRALRSEGSLINNTTDSLLTSISITNPIWVRFSLSQEQAANLRQASMAVPAQNNPNSQQMHQVKLLLSDGKEYPIAGKLNFTSSTIDPRIGAVQLRAEFANPDAILWPGQFARVQVISGEQDAVLIPQAAVTQNDQGKIVWIADKTNHVISKTIQAVQWLGKDWIVTGGLASGDKVIIDNLLKMRPAMEVAPKVASISSEIQTTTNSVKTENTSENKPSSH